MRDDCQRDLYRYPRLAEELRQLDERIRETEAMLLSCYGAAGGTLDPDAVGRAGPGDPTAAASGRALKLRAMLDRLYAASTWRMDVRAKVDAFLDRLDALERPVIELRYFRRLSWADVAAAEHVSIATAYRLHASALNKWPKSVQKVDSF